MGDQCECRCAKPGCVSEPIDGTNDSARIAARLRAVGLDEDPRVTALRRAQQVEQVRQRITTDRE